MKQTMILQPLDLDADEHIENHKKNWTNITPFLQKEDTSNINFEEFLQIVKLD